ncbi:NUC169 domain-containing protein, partial [Blyttiomyces helicus]
MPGPQTLSKKRSRPGTAPSPKQTPAKPSPRVKPANDEDDETPLRFDEIPLGDSDDNEEDETDHEEEEDDDDEQDGIPEIFDAESSDEDEDLNGEDADLEDGLSGDDEDDDEEEDDDEAEGWGEEEEDEEDEEEEDEEESSDESDDEVAGVRILRRKDRPEIEPDYASDTSDEETNNTIGNVPVEWYEDFPHIGYDVNGKRIMRPAQGDELDAFLAAMDDPNVDRSVYDKLEAKNVVLSQDELLMLKRMQSHEFPNVDFDAYEPTVEWFTSKTEIHPLSSAPEPKRRFVPSKWEAEKIMRIVRAIRKGLIIPGKKTPPTKQKYYAIWDEADEPREDHPMHIPAPKMALPEHDESYNPPAEYVPTPQEVAEWQDLDPEDRPKNYLPK